jgi:hypothetical protein
MATPDHTQCGIDQRGIELSCADVLEDDLVAVRIGMLTRLSKSKPKHWRHEAVGTDEGVLEIHDGRAVDRTGGRSHLRSDRPPSGWEGGLGGVISNVTTLSCWMNRSFTPAAAAHRR